MLARLLLACSVRPRLAQMVPLSICSEVRPAAAGMVPHCCDKRSAGQVSCAVQEMPLQHPVLCMLAASDAAQQWTCISFSLPIAFFS